MRGDFGTYDTGNLSILNLERSLRTGRWPEIRGRLGVTEQVEAVEVRVMEDEEKDDRWEVVEEDGVFKISGMLLKCLR